MAVVCGIQARMSSSRLPGKALADIHGAPMIQRVWDACGGAFNRILLTSDDSSDDPLAAFAASQCWAIHRGSLTNVLSRYVRAARMISPQVLVRVCGDAPFLEQRWIWRAVEEVEKYDEPVFVPGALHAGTPEHWLRCEEDADIDDREHAGAAWFELYGRTVKCVPDDYMTVNNPEQLEEARRRWVRS